MDYINKFVKKNYVASSFLIYLLGAIFLQGISIITTPIFTRILSTSDYGITSIFNTWVTFFAIFIGLQVSGSIATARVHKEENQFEGYMKNIIILSFIGFLVISIYVMIFKDRVSQLFQINVKLIPHLLIQSYGLSCAVLYSTYTIQTKKTKDNIKFSIVVSLLTIALSLILVISFSQNKYLGKIYAGTCIQVIVIIWVLKKFIYGKKANARLPDWKYAIALGSPLIIHLLSNIVIGQSDRLFLNKLIGKDAVGIYSVAYSIGSLGMLFAEVGNKIWSPWYLDNSKALNYVIINTAAKKYIIALSGVFIVVMLIAPEIVKIMAPKEYWSGVGSLIIITGGIYFQFLYRFPLGYEQFSRNMKWVAVCTIISALINLWLNYVFIKRIGMIGAAVATLISYIVLFGMHEFVARKIIKGYNIQFTSYIPGMISCLFISVLAYLVIDYWYIRYSILFILVFILAAYLYKKQLIKIN